MASTESDMADLFVIGGGINGCGISRDAAGRGRRVDHVEHACVEEAGQRQYFRDVVSQPRAVLGFDVRIEVDVHLVDHIADGLCVHIATSPIAMLAAIAKLSRIV